MIAGTHERDSTPRLESLQTLVSDQPCRPGVGVARAVPGKWIPEQERNLDKSPRAHCGVATRLDALQHLHRSAGAHANPEPAIAKKCREPLPPPAHEQKRGAIRGVTVKVLEQQNKGCDAVAAQRRPLRTTRRHRERSVIKRSVEVGSSLSILEILVTDAGNLE